MAATVYERELCHNWRVHGQWNNIYCILYSILIIQHLVSGVFVHVTAMCLSLCITLIHIHGEFLATSKKANKVSWFLPTRFFHKPFKTLCVLSESRSDTRMKETTFSFSLTGSFLACECTLHLAPPILKSDWRSIVPISALIGQYAPSRARLNGFFCHC